MKKTHLFAFALAAALTATPTFAQQENDKPADAPKTQEKAPAEKDKAVKPAEGDKAKVKDENRKPEARESKLPQSDQEPAVKDNRTEQKDAARMPQSEQAPAAQDRDNRNDAKRGDTSDRDRQAQYHFKGDEKTKLRSSYRDIDHVNRSQRVSIARQQILPVEVRTQIEPVPVDVVSILPPAPEGFVFGFVDGYCVVYDPNTFFVLEVIDLF